MAQMLAQESPGSDTPTVCALGGVLGKNEVFGVSRCLMGAEKRVMGTRVEGSALLLWAQPASMTAARQHGQLSLPAPGTCAAHQGWTDG